MKTSALNSTLPVLSRSDRFARGRLLAPPIITLAVTRLAVPLAITLAVGLLSAGSTLGHAEEAPAPKEFEAQKAEILSHLDGRLKTMQEHRACVAGASDRDALKKCRESMRDHREGMRDAWQKKRDERRKARRSRRSE